MVAGIFRSRVVSQATFAVVDKERAALDGEASVVGLRRDNAGLDRKTRAPEGVRLTVRGSVDGVRSRRGSGARLRRWTKALMSSQVQIKRRPCVWAGGGRGVGLIGPERRRFTVVDRGVDRRSVERITSWTPHGLPRLLEGNRIATHVLITGFLIVALRIVQAFRTNAGGFVVESRLIYSRDTKSAPRRNQDLRAEV
jgi:hypothetical protein